MKIFFFFFSSFLHIGSGLFIIVRGTCIVTQNNSETGETHTLTRLHPGHFFGEMSLMNEEDQTVANVVCGDKPVVSIQVEK